MLVSKWQITSRFIVGDLSGGTFIGATVLSEWWTIVRENFGKILGPPPHKKNENHATLSVLSLLWSTIDNSQRGIRVSEAEPNTSVSGFFRDCPLNSERDRSGWWRRRIVAKYGYRDSLPSATRFGDWQLWNADESSRAVNFSSAPYGFRCATIKISSYAKHIF